MKLTSALLRTSICLALVVCIVSLAGCGSSSGYKKSDSTTAKMDSLKAELLLGKAQIGKTVTALNSVVAQANQDPRKAFETFAKEVKRTDSQAKKISSRARDMKKQGAAYFKKWESEFKKIASPELQTRFEQRKAVVEAEYKKISGASDQLSEHYSAFMSNIEDIQRVLSIDLTSANISAISDIVQKTTTESKTINSLVQQYVDALDAVSAEMRPAQ